MVSHSQCILRPTDLWWSLRHNRLRPLRFEAIRHLQLIVERRLVHDLTKILVIVGDLVSDEVVLLKIVVHLGVHLSVSQVRLRSRVRIDLL